MSARLGIRPPDAKQQWLLLRWGDSSGSIAPSYEFVSLHAALSSADWTALQRGSSHLYRLNEDGSLGEWVYSGQKELAR